ncbi:hypothetical protein Pcac1_g3153 [Phytophthora cactorum]|nr:hypothetical protein Pcac1_g3153 [Phytophthora cactorum]
MHPRPSQRSCGDVCCWFELFELATEIDSPHRAAHVPERLVLCTSWASQGPYLSIYHIFAQKRFEDTSAATTLPIIMHTYKRNATSRLLVKLPSRRAPSACINGGAMAFSSKQVGDESACRSSVSQEASDQASRQAVGRRDGAATRAHCGERAQPSGSRSSVLHELQDDLEQAQTLGQPDLLKDLDRRAQAAASRTTNVVGVCYLRNLKLTARCVLTLIQSHGGATCSALFLFVASELGYEEEGYVEDENADDDEYSGRQ